MNQLAQSLLDLPRLGKRVLVMLVDALLCFGTVWLAMSLRFEQWIALDDGPLLMAASVGMVLALPLFVIAGMYQAIFRYSGLPVLIAVIRAMGLYALAFILVFGIAGVAGVPRSVAVLQPLLLLVSIGGSRMLAWIWLGGNYQRLIQRCDLPRVLVFGAGSAGRQLVGAIHNSHEMDVIAFLDDDASLHGSILKGLKIYNPARLPELVKKLQVDLILLANDDQIEPLQQVFSVAGLDFKRHQAFVQIVVNGHVGVAPGAFRKWGVAEPGRQAPLHRRWPPRSSRD